MTCFDHLIMFSEDDEDDEYHDTNCIWLSQDELIEHVNSIGCTLDLPPFSLSSSQAQQLVYFVFMSISYLRGRNYRLSSNHMKNWKRSLRNTAWIWVGKGIEWFAFWMSYYG